MAQDGVQQDKMEFAEIPELLEMEMEEFDEFQGKYSEVSGKVEQLLKNFVLMKISNKRNELNILYLFQKINNKKVNSEKYENVFSDLDSIFEDINNNNYKFDELITKNNELGKRINPKIRELLK